MDSKHIPSSVLELSILLTDDREIHSLNRSYRGKDKATDVLSFSQIENQEYAGEILGDLVISLDTTKRQAKEYGVSFQAEFLRLMIHGTLHLFGFDHENVAKRVAQKMRRHEEKLFFALSGFSKSKIAD